MSKSREWFYVIAILLLAVGLIVVNNDHSPKQTPKPSGCVGRTYKVGDQIAYQDNKDGTVYNGVIMSYGDNSDDRCFYGVNYRVPYYNCGWSACHPNGYHDQFEYVAQKDLVERQAIK